MPPTRDWAARTRPWMGWVGIALAAGVAGMAGSYLVVGRRPEFVAAPLDRFVLAASPDMLVSFAITELGALGHQLAFLSALVLTCLTLGLAAIPGVLALRRGWPALGVGAGAGIHGSVVYGLTGSLHSSIGAAVGIGITLIVVALYSRSSTTRSTRTSTIERRQVLGAFGASIGLGTIGLLARRFTGQDKASGIDIPEDAGPEVRELLTLARDRSLNVEGLEPLVSTDFYEVDINNINPDVSTDDWTLAVTGAVETEREYDVGDIEAMAFENRFVTVRCVGDQQNGRQMDNALWGGVPAAALLREADPRGDRVILRGEDGFYNEFPLEDLTSGLFAYRMNGRRLPRGHGYPLRALVPGHWGEISVKWLTEIEIREEDTMGYWEYRGWEGTGEVTTVAKIWQVNHLDAGRIELAGHVYAGTRGVEAVEVSTDGGQSWMDAELSEPLPGADVWRQWRHVYGAVSPHEVVVRTRDGTGGLQTESESGPRPDGATGWVSMTVEPK